MGLICIFLGAGFLIPVCCSCIAASHCDEKIEKMLKEKELSSTEQNS
jgi:hypothetical protein